MSPAAPSSKTAEIEALLPLTAAVFHILLALADRDRHGYAIAKDIGERTGGRVAIGPGTLYGTLIRMTGANLVEERPGAASEARRRTYRITPFGRAVARAEAERLVQLVDIAKAKSVLAPGRR